MIKVLIVEDDAEEMRLYEGAFQLNGYGVDKAHNGEEALQKLKLAEEKPAIIVLDLMMPNMNGFQLLAEIKKDDKLKHIPVLMVTAEARKEDIVMAAQQGAAGYIVKPFTKATLEDKVTLILTKLGLK